MRTSVRLLHGHEADQTTVAQLLHRNTHKVKNKASFGFSWMTSWWDHHPWTATSLCKGNRIENCWHHLRQALKWGTANTERWMSLASRELWWGKNSTEAWGACSHTQKGEPWPQTEGEHHLPRVTPPSLGAPHPWGLHHHQHLSQTPSSAWQFHPSAPSRTIQTTAKCHRLTLLEFYTFFAEVLMTEKTQDWDKQL